MLVRRLAPLVIAMAVCTSDGWGEEYILRTWTNDQGQSIEARLKRVSGRDALLDHEGETLRAPTNRLSEEDQEWVNLAKQLSRWRDWTLADGTTVRAKLEDFEDGTLSLDDRTEVRALTLAEISDADRELMAQVYEGIATETSDEMSDERFDDGDFGSRNPPPHRVDSFTPDEFVLRTWTSVDGKSVEGEFRGIQRGKVVMFVPKANREFQVALDMLSDDDQQFIADQVAAAAAGQATLAGDEPPQTAGGSQFDETRRDIYGRMAPGSEPAESEIEQVDDRFASNDDIPMNDRRSEFDPVEDVQDTQDESTDVSEANERLASDDDFYDDQAVGDSSGDDFYDEDWDEYDDYADAEYDEEPIGALGMLMAFVGFSCICVGGIWFTIVAFMESPLWGLGCMFVPFVSLVFLSQHSDKAGLPFSISVGGYLLCFMAGFL